MKVEYLPRARKRGMSEYARAMMCKSLIVACENCKHMVIIDEYRCGCGENHHVLSRCLKPEYAVPREKRIPTRGECPQCDTINLRQFRE